MHSLIIRNRSRSSCLGCRRCWTSAAHDKDEAPMRIAPTVRAPINVFMIAPHEGRDPIPVSYRRSSYSFRARNQMRWTVPAGCARAVGGHAAAPPRHGFASCVGAQPQTRAL